MSYFSDITCCICGCIMPYEICAYWAFDGKNSAHIHCLERIRMKYRRIAFRLLIRKFSPHMKRGWMDNRDAEVRGMEQRYMQISEDGVPVQVTA